MSLAYSAEYNMLPRLIPTRFLMGCAKYRIVIMQIVIIILQLYP